MASMTADERITLASVRVTRTTGQPTAFVERFTITDPGAYEDIALSATAHRSPKGQPLTRTEVRFNGRLVWSGLDIANAGTLAVPQALSGSNTISVELWGAPGSAVTVTLSAKRKGLAWRVLAEENSGPQSNSNAAHNSSIYLPSEDAILVVEQTGDYQDGRLWRFSLATKDWRQLSATNWPRGKFRDYVLDPVRNELVVSWDGIGEIWAIPVNGGAWYLRHAASNWDSHYIGSFFFDRGRNRLSHLFGYGFGTYRSDFHAFHDGAWQAFTTSGDGVWPRISVCSLGAQNADGTSIFFSGGGGDANPAQQDPEPQYDDLLRFDLTTLRFTYLAPRRHRAGIDRICSAVAVAGTRLYRSGGVIYRTDDERSPDADPTNELQQFDGSEWRTLPTTNSPPSSWYRALMFYDPRRGDLVQVGGWNGARWVFAVHAIRID